MTSAADNRTTELKPCPFCGGEADEYEGEYGNGIYCMQCGAMVGEPIHLDFDIAERVSYEQAVEAWNTRAAYETDNFFYLPKPKKKIPYTSEPMIKRTEYGYKIGAIADVHERAVREWQEQLNDYIIGRICDVFRPERTCRIVKTWSDSDYVDDWNYRCSECKCNIPVNERDPETGDVISAANYCPNCGARVLRNTSKYSETDAKVVSE
jgi:DNA-directed RNA polymerase subunit RPC12/RpoP